MVSPRVRVGAHFEQDVPIGVAAWSGVAVLAQVLVDEVGCLLTYVFFRSEGVVVVRRDYCPFCAVVIGQVI